MKPFHRLIDVTPSATKVECIACDRGAVAYAHIETGRMPSKAYPVCRKHRDMVQRQIGRFLAHKATKGRWAREVMDAGE